VTAVEGSYSESGAEPVTRSVPLSHVSVELGHLYPEDLGAGPSRLREVFRDAAPWAETAAASVVVPGRRRRVSTCFFIDDYFGELPGPDVLIPDLLAAAADAEVRVDYLARESACALAQGPAGRVSPAAILTAQLVEEPAPGTMGGRPPAAEAGWLCNGVRSPAPSITAAMEPAPSWAPPVQNAARRHSVFLDVQLWDDTDGIRTWSCAMLAATWQALRLGLLRSHGLPLVEPSPAPATWPHRWDQLPAVLRLNPQADPFCGYTTLSVLSPRFLPVEVAVRTILGQVHHDPAVLGQVDARAADERLALAREVPDRIQYVFAGRSTTDPP
jgi:hypothetical protein